MARGGALMAEQQPDTDTVKTMTERLYDVLGGLLVVAEALVTDAAPAEKSAALSLAWALYLGSPVSVPLDAYRPQTNIIGRNTEGEQLTPKANAP